jgi:hypothetical protein
VAGGIAALEIGGAQVRHHSVLVMSFISAGLAGT